MKWKHLLLLSFLASTQGTEGSFLAVVACMYQIIRLHLIIWYSFGWLCVIQALLLKLYGVPAWSWARVGFEKLEYWWDRVE